MNEDEPPFVMADWATTHKLKRKTTDALAKEDYNELVVLRAMTASDIAHLDITQGQARALKLALAELGNIEFSPAKAGGQGANESAGAKESAKDTAAPGADQAILAAGELLDRMLREDGGEDPLPQSGHGDPPSDEDRRTGKASTGGGRYESGATGGMADDPRLSLTVRASKRKALQVSAYLTETVKGRIAKRKKETFKVIEGTDGVLSFKTDDSAQVYLSMAEWGAANVRLMADLLAQGRLQRREVEYYLAYTAYIYDLASQYEWQSLLAFDVRYREIQAEYDHVWGQPAPHLEAQLLMPRRQMQQVVSKQDNRRRNGNVGGYSARRMTSADDNDLCRIFANSGQCPYGDRCKFQHGNAAKRE